MVALVWTVWIIKFKWAAVSGFSPVIAIVPKSNFGPARLTDAPEVKPFKGVGQPAPGEVAVVPVSMLDTGWYVPFVGVVMFAILNSPKVCGLGWPTFIYVFGEKLPIRLLVLGCLAHGFLHWIQIYSPIWRGLPGSPTPTLLVRAADDPTASTYQFWCRAATWTLQMLR